MEGVAVGAEGSNSPERLGTNRSIKSAKKIHTWKKISVGGAGNCWCSAGIYEFSGEGVERVRVWVL